MLRSFETALGFLTIFRVPVDPDAGMGDVGKSAWAFPLVGVVIGLILLVCAAVFNANLPGALTAVLVIAVWVVLTGGLHLDGWTDCCDALAASVPPERRVEILKDSRLGTFGATGLILLLGSKIAAVANQNLPLILLVVAPVIGRTMMVLVAHKSMPSNQGMAAGFIPGLDRRLVTWAVVIGIIPALIAGWQGILATAAAYVFAMGFRRLAQARLNMVNGDVLGAVCELSEAVVLVIGSLKW